MLRHLSFLIAMPVLLAPAAEASEHTIDEITVTATRRTEQAGDVSASLTLLDGDKVQQEMLITDALAEQTGVFLQQTTPGQGAAIVRGQRGSAVLHLVDGMRLNNAIFRSAPTQYFALVPVTAVERIEVIRGTPSSLYGSDAVGGVIQVVTRVPEIDSEDFRSNGNIAVEIDSGNRRRNLRASVDAGNNRYAFNVSGDYLETGDRRTGAGERITPSGYESWSIRTALSARPVDDIAWLFDLQFLRQPSTPRVDELVPGFGEAEPASSEFFFAPNQRTFARIRRQRDSGWMQLDWNFDLAWQRIDDDRVTRNYQSPERRLESNSSDLVGLVINASKLFEAGSWVAGLEYYDDRVQSERTAVDINSGQSEVSTPRFPDGSQVRQLAVFANGDRQLSPRNRLSGGLRLSSVRVDLAATMVTPATQVDATDISGDAGWIVDLGQEWQLTANAGFGFRAPNVFDLGTLGERPGNRFNIPNADLESEKVRQVEAGVRYATDRGRFDAVMYAMQYDNRISSVLTGDSTPDGRDIVQSRNITESRYYGAELAAETAFGDFYRLAAVLNYTWGEQTIGEAGTEPADRVPPLSGRLNLAYERSSWTADAWVRFAGRQDRLSARDVRDSRINPQGTAGWGIAGISAGYTTIRDWQFLLSVDNLFDMQFRRHGSGIDATGRNAMLAIRKTW